MISYMCKLLHCDLWHSRFFVTYGKTIYTPVNTSRLTDDRIIKPLLRYLTSHCAPTSHVSRGIAIAANKSAGRSLSLYSYAGTRARHNSPLMVIFHCGPRAHYGPVRANPGQNEMVNTYPAHSPL